jgi:acyl transferase domain-containing protein
MPFVFSAESRPELVRRLLKGVDPGLGEFAERARELASAAVKAHRLAIVADHPGDLAAKAERAARLLATADPSPFNLANSVIYSPPAARGATAFLFAGYGAQGLGVFAELLARFSRVRGWFYGLDLDVRARILGNPLLFPSSAPPAAPDRGDGTSLLATLDAILTVDLALHALLEGLGVGCDVVAGHSFGENAALVASGIVPGLGQVATMIGMIAQAVIETVRAARGRCAVRWLALPAGSRALLDSLPDDFAPGLSVILDNCSEQTIVCGPVDEIGGVEAAVRRGGGLCFDIPGLGVPVHSPMFPVGADRLKDIYANLAVAAPRQPVYSCATASRFPTDPSAIRELLCRQWVSPVRFRETVKALYDDGVRAFIEIGPGSRLAGFVRDTLRGTDAFALSTNHIGRDPSLQLTTALAHLFTRGLDIDLASYLDELCREPEPLGDVDRRQDARVAFAVGTDHSAIHKSADPRPAMPSDQNRQSIEHRILDHVASILGLTGADLIDPDRGFFEQGMTSLNCVELASRLEHDVGPLEPTIAFDYPSAARLALYLERSPQLRSNGETIDPARRQPDYSPIAIIGIGCRFPGSVSTPESFWSLLHDGRDAITERPLVRGDLRREDGSPELGGFLSDVRGFDPEFFGISPREAETLDPQQRLILEVAWEAIEHAAIDARRLEGSATGAFIGLCAGEYAQRFSMQERMEIGGYIATGNASSIAAGRLAYVLGLNGPCMAVDTACSSSLVAVHLACQSLRAGECEAALAGGVNVLLAPETNTYLRRAGALSPDGRCKAFDAAADGYVRAEGCGMVVLKRLADAVAAGDTVLAVIRGSAVNHDGRSSGLTVPNGVAQEALIRRALFDAGIEPGRVGYVEAHGTGTSLGDPIEVNALGRVYGGSRPAGLPLLIGSLKSNIGHLEAAAGVAGLIKLTMMLRHRALVPSLHVRVLNPKVDWDRTPVRVCAHVGPWDTGGLPLIGAVSSFGMSGTNAHMIVQGPPEVSDPSPSTVSPAPYLVTLSATTEAALADLAARYRDHLSSGGAGLADLGYTSQVGRTHFRYRKAMVLNDTNEATERLGKLATSRTVALRPGPKPRIAFLFTGQGARIAGIGRRLYETEPVFRRCLEECDALLRPQIGGSLLELWHVEPEAAEIGRTALIQPALFVLEYALARTWQSWGVTPDAVMGHSIGEYAAAAIAGVFSLEDGLAFVADRARLMQSLPPDGAMSAVGASESRVLETLGSSAVEIAAVNEPEQVVISGPANAIAEAERQLKDLGISTIRLRVAHAFHSAAMDPIIEGIRDRASRIRFAPAKIPLISNLTGRRAGEEITTPEYWAEHARRTVRFSDGMLSLAGGGATCCLEIGPQPVLVNLGRRSVLGPAFEWLPSLSPESDDRARMLESLGALYEAGVDIDWTNFHSGREPRKVAIPTYPFQRAPYWLELPEETGPRAGEGRRPFSPDSTLLGQTVDLCAPDWDGSVRYESHAEPATCPLLLDQRILGRPQLPVAGILAMMVCAGVDLVAEGLVIERFVAHRVPATQDPIVLHTWLTPLGDGDFQCRIYAKPGVESGRAAWELVAESMIRGGMSCPDCALRDDTLSSEPANTTAGGDFYVACQRLGITHGPSLRVVHELSVGGSQTTGRLQLPVSAGAEARVAAAIDGALQMVGAMLGVRGWHAAAVHSIERMWLGSAISASIAVVAACEPSDHGEPLASARLTDPADGAVVTLIEGIRYLANQPDPTGAHAESPTVSKTLSKVRAATDDQLRQKIVLDSLNAIVVAILRHPRGHVLDAFHPFNRMGFDSLTALQLSGALQVELGVHVPPVLILDGHSLSTLAGVIVSAVLDESSVWVVAGSPVASTIEWTEGEL